MKTSMPGNTLVFFLSGAFVAYGIVAFLLDWSTILFLVFILLGLFLLIRGLYKTYNHKRFMDAFAENIELMAKGDFETNLLEDYDGQSFLTPQMNHLYESVTSLQEGVKLLLKDSVEQRQIQKLILENLNEGIIFADERGVVQLETPLVRNILSASKVNRKILNDSEEQYIFLRGVNFNHIWNFMKTAMQDNIEFTSDLNITIDNEVHFLEVYATPLALPEALGALAVIRDVTHIKQLERMRENFVANVTHELKTPLTSIIGYIDLLRSKRRSTEEAEQFYEIIEIEADRLQFLISDLLELSEIQSGDIQHAKNEMVYFYPVIDEIFVDLDHMAAKSNISLNLDVDPDFFIRANESRIKQLMTNLITNAIKYNKENGEVWVTSSQERGRNVIIVRDTGIGIPQEDLPRIFERFYRVSKSRSRALGGTGLGLAIVKHIVSLYGGSVQVDSKLGEGTSFILTFPGESISSY